MDNYNSSSDNNFTGSQAEQVNSVQAYGEGPVKTKKIPKPRSREILEWVLCIVVAFLVAYLIRTYVFSLVKVDGQSMEPTLQHGDRLFVRQIMYTPEAGDIIILRPPHNPETFYIKRVIATEGQVVNIDKITGKVSVDDKILKEEYIDSKIVKHEPNKEGKTETKIYQPTDPGARLEYPYTVPKGHVFVLGDNRHPGGSTDSRSMGPVPLENVVGKAVFRLFPFKSFGGLY